MRKETGKVPKHIGIILDGNRRFAKRLMMKPWKGHEWGEKKLEPLLEWCKDYKINELTLYTFSIENFDRPKKEFEYLMDVFRKGFDKWMNNPKIMNEGVKVNFIGRTWMLPKDIQEKMKRFSEKTKKNSSFILNFAMAYGGRAEIIDAVKKISKEIKKGKLSVDEVNEEVFSNNLYNKSEPDLIIRTGGEQRLSGFLLWQGAYAEIFWVENLWPEFSKKDFVNALKSYSKRERRFGK